jgi:hypothetical protein
MASKKQVRVLFKQQTVRGTATALSAATDAFLLLEEGFSAGHSFETAKVQHLDGTLSAPDILVGSSVFTLDAACGFVGAGTAGAAPKFGALLKCGGFTENVIAVAPLRTEYLFAPSPGVSIGGSSGVYMGDQLIPGKDVFNAVELSVEVNQVGKIKFSSKGILNGDVTAAALPAATLTKIMPAVGGPTNTSKFFLGAAGAVTYTAGAIAGGSQFLGKSFTVMSGAKVDAQPWCGGLEADISDAEPTVKILCDMSAAEYAAMFVRQRDSTPISFGAKHVLSPLSADVAGRTCGVHCPRILITSLKKAEEFNGRIIAEIEGSAMGSAPGVNDAIRIFFL